MRQLLGISTALADGSRTEQVPASAGCGLVPYLRYRTAVALYVYLEVFAYVRRHVDYYAAKTVGPQSLG